MYSHARQAESIQFALNAMETQKLDLCYSVPFTMRPSCVDQKPRHTQQGDPILLIEPSERRYGPFTFTLSIHRCTPLSFKIEFDIVRTSIENDGAVDQPIRLAFCHCQLGEASLVLKPAGRHSLESTIGSMITLTSTHEFSDLPKLFDETRTSMTTAKVDFAAFTAFSPPPRPQTNNLPNLKSLPLYVDSSSPNDVSFILSTNPNKRLYASKALLSASSSYFKQAFNSSRSSRTPFSNDPNPAFVDDSDAEEEELSDDGNESDLPNPESIGTRSSSKRRSEGGHTGRGGEEAHSPKKRKKGRVGGAREGAGSGDEAGEEGVTNRGLTEIHVDDVAYPTIRALLVYLIGGKIQFA